MDPLNTSEIERFISAVKNAENSRAKEVKLDINAAKNLAFTLGIVMGRLHGDLEKLVSESNNTSNEVINITMDGSSFE